MSYTFVVSDPARGTSSTDPLMEDIARLVAVMRSLNSNYGLLDIWAEDEGVRKQALVTAEERYGLPPARSRDREPRLVQLYFWLNIKNVLEADIATLREAQRKPLFADSVYNDNDSQLRLPSPV